MRKIMIVDDEPDLVFSIKCGLENFSEEYKIIGAGSGHECFELLKKDQIPDLILLDVMMPEMNGWDVFTKLKEKTEWREEDEKNRKHWQLCTLPNFSNFKRISFFS